MSTTAPAVTAPTAGSPDWLIAQAQTLEASRGDLLDQIGANRDLLRNLAKVNALDTDQTAFVTTFYPVTEKGDVRSADEIEATRKLRDAARKGQPIVGGAPATTTDTPAPAAPAAAAEDAPPPKTSGK